MYELKAQGMISSAHFLREYAGKCRHLHGHNWKVQVTIAAAELDNLGMVADFGAVKQRLNDFLSPMDHCCLNDLEYFKTHNPTTENIARHVFEGFSAAVAPIVVRQVEVWESEAASVIYRG
ncbi:MAG: 6-carboxytetrahydropterin synthase QueD [Candidatus Omnitrophica bacterium]|nr:6-carboxytetrahydropterin synthase QueD [Candidatus Omnitrophota bacterium]